MRRRRLTVRRLMALVALAALLCGVAIHDGDQPGLYLQAAGRRCGACRDDRDGRAFLPDGTRGRPGWQAGLWDADPRSSGAMRIGVRLKDGRVVLFVPWRGGLVI
jgi:hypothetical protein